MTLDPARIVREIFDNSVAVHQRFAETNIAAVTAAADALCSALAEGRKVLAFGNGGSASDAEHLVAEFVGRFEIERRALPAISLTSDSSIVTAVSNDYGYNTVFTRQVEALGRAGDVALGISTSGQSVNVQAALAAAKAIGLVTIALTGRDGGQMGSAADIHINVAETSTARIQEVHRTVMHAICAIVDRRFERKAC